MEDMNATARIPTDLVTPLGAYLRLRRLGTRELPARVGRAGPPRPLLVRRLRLAARLLRGGRAAGGAGRRLPRLRLRGEARADRVAARRSVPTCRRAVSSSPTCSSASTTCRASPRCWPAIRPRSRPRWPNTPTSPRPVRSRAIPTERSPDREEHERRVRQAKEHIAAGDAFQIVLSQRAVRRTDASAVALYRALRRINPSPYLFLLELGDVSLVGSSPETHVKLEGGRASLNPIAGTIAAGEGAEESLLASEKDRAEHVMLVDLGRNDLSRVCRPGTVRVAAVPRAGALLARGPPRLGGRRRDPARPERVRPPARDVSGRHGVGRA